METPSRPLKFFKGCFIALPVLLVLWLMITGKTQDSVIEEMLVSIIKHAWSKLSIFITLIPG